MVAPLASMPALSVATTASRSALACARVSGRRGAAGWMPRREERLVGVDVPDARDPGLVEQERLDRRAAARARAPAGARAVNSGSSGSMPTPGGEDASSAVGALEQHAGAEAPRVARSARSPPVVEREAHARVRARGPPRGRRAACRSCAGA